MPCCSSRRLSESRLRPRAWMAAWRATLKGPYCRTSRRSSSATLCTAGLRIGSGRPPHDGLDCCACDFSAHCKARKARFQSAISYNRVRGADGVEAAGAGAAPSPAPALSVPLPLDADDAAPHGPDREVRTARGADPQLAQPPPRRLRALGGEPVAARRKPVSGELHDRHVVVDGVGEPPVVTVAGGLPDGAQLVLDDGRVPRRQDA